MERKKTQPVEPMEPMIYKEVSDLGAGAYLLMLGWKVIGRKGRAIVFQIEETAIDEFEQNTLEYLSSDFHRFDSCLMSLKKINEYMPEKK